ncbi:MAG: hypothetical protein H6838_17405 [Planctomycetes bacterium]|nr:hypothetical protein [Planctomycetota bacterium]
MARRWPWSRAPTARPTAATTRSRCSCSACRTASTACSRWRWSCWSSSCGATSAPCSPPNARARACARRGQRHRPAPTRRPHDAPPRARLALLPFGALIAITSTLLLLDWPNDEALLAASATALAVSIVGTRACRALPWSTMLRRALAAMRTLLLPILVLFLAWTLGHVTHDLGTSHYLTAAARHWLRPEVLPIVLFLLAGLIAFATGTSFGTMAILLPNVVLLAHELGRDGTFFGPGGSDLLLLLGIAAVLEGAIFGDHCSPISDTTLLSSLSSGCDHVEHVVTQLPYALLAMTVTVLFGYLPIVTFGPGAWWFSLFGGLGAMAAWLRWFGRDPDALSG